MLARPTTASQVCGVRMRAPNRLCGWNHSVRSASNWMVVSVSRSGWLNRRDRSQLTGVALAASLLTGCGSVVTPSSSPTASPSIEASAAPSLTIPALKFKVLDVEGPARVCGPPVQRSDGDQADADAGFAQIQADTTTYAAILRHEHLSPDSASIAFRLAVFHAYQALQVITLITAGNSYRFEIPTTNRTVVSGNIDRSGTIIGTSSRPLLGGCPICLTGATRISTPNGPIPVSQLRVGMPIWTLGPDGGRQTARVQSVAHVPMPFGHDAVRLVLADGRHVTASAGHPTLDGRFLGRLHVGDILDGSGVVSVEIIHLHDSGTYDLLPSGPSGAYWADGVLLRSTLTSS